MKSLRYMMLVENMFVQTVVAPVHGTFQKIDFNLGPSVE